MIVAYVAGLLIVEMIVVLFASKSNYYMKKDHDSCCFNRKTIKTSKIRNVLPIKLVVQDTSQIDELSKELNSLKSQIKEKQNALELSKLALSLCKRELEKAKKAHIPSQ